MHIHLNHENWFIQHVIAFFSSFVYPGLDSLWASRLVLLEKQMTLIIPLYLVHALKFYCPSCFFTFVTSYVLFWLFYVLRCVCLFSLTGLYPWFTFFWFPLESWFTWWLFWYIQLIFSSIVSKLLQKSYKCGYKDHVWSRCSDNYVKYRSLYDWTTIFGRSCYALRASVGYIDILCLCLRFKTHTFLCTRMGARTKI